MKYKYLILYHYLITKVLRNINSKRIYNIVLQVRLFSLVSFLKKHSPYHQRFKTVSFDKWPVINKSIILDNFKDFNTANITKDQAFNNAIESEKNPHISPLIGDVILGLSSGTSGTRGIVMSNSKEKAIWSGLILAKALPRLIFKKQKIALFLRANSDIYNTVKSSTIEFQYFSLDNNFSDDLVRLEQYAPDVIVSPPSTLRLIAQAKKEDHIKINPLRVYSGAEVLEKIDRIYLEQIFGPIVYEIYQCTEGFLAISCEHGSLHLNEDFVLLEKHFIDSKRGKFLPIITDTLRRTQPIVKFRHNDIMTLRPTPCPCGSHHTALNSIEGRTDDIFYLLDAKDHSTIPFFPGDINSAVMKYSDEDLLEYRIVQESTYIIQIAVKSNDLSKSFQQCAQGLFELFTNQNCQLPEFVNVPYEAPARYIKLKRVESRLKLFNL